MELSEQIQADLKNFLKTGKTFEVGVLRMAIAALHNREIEKRIKLSKSEPLEKLDELSKLSEEEVIATISSEIKKRREAIIEYEKGKRQDLADREKKEIEILQKYLPEQLSEEEIKKLAKEAIKKIGAEEPKDMGKVMAELMPKVKGKADGSLVSKIVKDFLTPKNE